MMTAGAAIKSQTPVQHGLMVEGSRSMLFLKIPRLFIIPLAVLVFGMALTLLTPANTAGKGITAVTDKLVYQRNEVINIIFINDLEDSVFSHIQSATPVFGIKQIEFRSSNGPPKKLFAYCQYPHCTNDTDVPGEVKSGEKVTFGWKPLVFVDGTSETVLPEPGQYRLQILYQNKERRKCESVYTNKFTINQEEGQ